MDKGQAVAALVERIGHCTYGSAYCDGLKPAQWSALRYFACANRFSQTTSALARYQGTSQGAASQTIATLVDKKFLRRTPDARDKRKHDLRLTAKAHKLMADDPIDDLIAAVNELDGRAKGTLAQSLETILEQLLAMKGERNFGFCNDCRFLKSRACGDAKRDGQTPESYCALVEQALSEDELDQMCINFERE